MIAAAPAQPRHPLHAGERVWPESNCYLDLWIELLHSLRLDPLPMLQCTIGSRFEIDQWTFVKPTASEIRALYGIRVEELNIWWNTLDQVEAQLDHGRTVLIEVDGYFLPDTAATTYQRAHGKTTIGIAQLDRPARQLRYFHNSGKFMLSGDDFDGALAGVQNGLPLFAELVDANASRVRDVAELREIASTLGRKRFSHTTANPFSLWAEQAEAHLEALSRGNDHFFHLWAFATVRQAGATHDLLAHWCRWMGSTADWTRAATLLADLAQRLAAQQFRLARVPGGGRRPDFSSSLASCANLWSDAQSQLHECLFGSSTDGAARGYHR